MMPPLLVLLLPQKIRVVLLLEIPVVKMGGTVVPTATPQTNRMKVILSAVAMSLWLVPTSVKCIMS
jgi:hypothetical protein